MTKKTNSQVVNPFSDKFMETWQLWKEYKKEIFGFVYKGVFSEQMTLKKLVELSNGEEDKAIRIVEQSISRQWQGLFPLHIPSVNGKSKQQTSGTREAGTIRQRVQEEFTKRYGQAGQKGNGTHPEAV